jgi:hypothetical protein
MEPEIQLWLEVLQRAVKDAELLLDAANRKPVATDDHLFVVDCLSLRRYFTSKSDRIGGVVFICDLVNLDPDIITRKVERDFLDPIDEIIRKRKQQKQAEQMLAVQRKLLLEVLNNRISALGGSDNRLVDNHEN